MITIPFESNKLHYRTRTVNVLQDRFLKQKGFLSSHKFDLVSKNCMQIFRTLHIDLQLLFIFV